jgi:hypothetical protein
VTTRTASRLTDPESALRLLPECLVISFRFAPDRGMLTLVCDFPQKTPGSAREFAAFVFHDVCEFSREFGNLERFRAFRETYESRHAGAVVVQGVRVEKGARSSRRVEFWLGVNFGGFSFEYASVEGFTRASSVEQVHGGFRYRDLHTKEEFDFLDPFAGLLG